MKISKKYILLIYLFFYLSLLTGFYFNEDFAGGYVQDLQTHNLLISNLFNNKILDGFLNYDKYYVPHSPVFIIYLIFLKKIFITEIISKLINLHFCLIIPIVIILCLKIRFQFKKNNLIYLLPSIIFFSPYYRSGSIWIDDNIFAIIFLSIAILFFLKYEYQNKSLLNIFLVTFFVALASYLRPIYCIFNIYFFLKFLLDNKLNKNLFIYILFNIFLILPAFYYVFILGINKWATSYLFRENIFTQLSLVSSLIFFYMIPILIFNLKSIFKKFNLLNSVTLVIIYLLLYFFFSYERVYSGGIAYKFSNILFNNNLLFYLIASISLLSITNIFIPKKGKIDSYLDLFLIIILILFEIDGVVYHETYDPLIYIVLFLMIKNDIFYKYFLNFNLKKLTIFYLFVFSFYTLSILKTLYY